MNFQQLKTILWLRWRLTRNQWTRSRGVGAVITMLVAVAMCMLAAASFAGGLLGGMLGLREAKPVVIMLVWLGVTVGFLFFWLIALVSEIQRSESIDLQRLMHLPVRLGQVFTINYLASHLALSILLFLPGMLGLAGGLAISRGVVMVLLVPLSLSMVFMITAWTYLLRGWLATLMANPRRRRAVIMGITFAFIVLSQGPNLYFNTFGGPGRRSSPGRTQERRRVANQQKLEQWMAMQKFIPPLWVSVGARGLAESRPLPALLGTFGCIAIGALGLQRAYRNTLRFYYGETNKKTSVQPRADKRQTTVPTRAKSGPRFLELQVPGVPEQAGALALATFRSMLRAPEVKMAWGSSFLVTLILGASFLLRSAPKLPKPAEPFIATGAVTFSIFMLVQFFANQFGFDRDGFRTLILSPAPRRLILLGKNLACLPPGAGFGLILLALITVWLRLSLLTLVAAVFQLAALLLIAGIVGNLLSIVAPYRIQPGSMKPTKMPGVAMLLMVLCHLFFPLAMFPVFVPPLAELLWRLAGWSSVVPVNLLLSVILTSLMALLYWQTLGPMGRLLQRRETRILSIVTVEVE